MHGGRRKRKRAEGDGEERKMAEGVGEEEGRGQRRWEREGEERGARREGGGQHLGLPGARFRTERGVAPVVVRGEAVVQIPAGRAARRGQIINNLRQPPGG